MADKTKRPKSSTTSAKPAKAAAVKPVTSTKPSGDKSSGSALLSRSTDRSEQRFAPTNSASAALSMLAMSLGALAVGAGVYGKFIRTTMGAAAEAHPWATYLLIGGALLFGAAAFLGAMPASPMRVGDAGVGVDKGGGIERLAWYEIDSVDFASGVLTLRGKGSVLAISQKAHGAAIQRIAAEAKRRLPNKTSDLSGLPAGSAAPGERLALEPVQLAGARCAASDRIIALEKDGRLCGRCGQCYHKEQIPDRCVSCDAKL